MGAVSAAELLAALTARAVRVEALGGGRLRVEAPAGTLTAADRDSLTRHKAELLALLAPNSSTAAAAPGPNVPTVPTVPVDGRDAEADRLLAELRAAVALARRESPGLPADVRDSLGRVLADALAQGEQYIRDRATEAARGWDALELLRRLVRAIPTYARHARNLAAGDIAGGLSADDRAFAARAIENDLGLPAGSVEVGPWLRSCPGCPHCRAPESGTGEAP
jgi:hypothetical protein